MKKIVIILFLSLSYIIIQAQRIIEVKYTEDMQGNYNFTCTNNAFCKYILQVDFTTLDNTKSDRGLPFRGEVNPGINKLFRLSKENANNPMQFKYQVKYNKGCINPVVNTDFTYLLPIAPGKEAQAYEMQNNSSAASVDAAASGGVPTETLNWYVIRLKMNPGDTIYAARRGTVTEVDVSSGLNDAGASSGGAENYIEINHADCSFARYGILKKNSAFVKPGQFVEAGRPIGLVGGDQFGRGSDVKFSVYYDQEKTENGSIKLYWNYVPIQFWTKFNGKGKLKHGATYTSEFPVTVMNQEILKPAVKKPAKKTKSK